MKEITLGAMLLYIFFGNVAANYPAHITAGHGTIRQLQNALNTTDVIWLLQRTYNIPEHQCVYVLKKSLRNFDYEFFQYYYDSRGINKKHLYAKIDFAEGSNGAKMTVSEKKDDKNGRTYLLVHYDEHHHCAIINLEDAKDSAKRKCEAHIWNQDVEKSMSKCLEHYNTYCDPYNEYKTTEQIVYKKECRIDPGC